MAMIGQDASQPSLAQPISLKGRRALITGGARGLGYPAAQRFAEAGAAGLLGDKDSRGATETAAAIDKHHRVPVHATSLDVTDAASVAAFADEGVRLLGGIDIWVNNAGI